MKACVGRLRQLVTSCWGRFLPWYLRTDIMVAWSVSGVLLVVFLFTAILYIDPAVLAISLDFRAANCTTVYSDHLLGVHNCSWTSCRQGCTTDVYRCWHVLVYIRTENTDGSVKELQPKALPRSVADHSSWAKLYPSAKGCGYPPEIDCKRFFETYGKVGNSFACWVTREDPNMAISEYNPGKLKRTLTYSFLPLVGLCLSTLYILIRWKFFQHCYLFIFHNKEYKAIQKVLNAEKRRKRNKRTQVAPLPNWMTENTMPQQPNGQSEAKVTPPALTLSLTPSNSKARLLEAVKEFQEKEETARPPTDKKRKEATVEECQDQDMDWNDRWKDALVQLEHRQDTLVQLE